MHSETVNTLSNTPLTFDILTRSPLFKIRYLHYYKPNAPACVCVCMCVCVSACVSIDVVFFLLNSLGGDGSDLGPNGGCHEDVTRH